MYYFLFVKDGWLAGRRLICTELASKVTKRHDRDCKFAIVIFRTCNIMKALKLD